MLAVLSIVKRTWCVPAVWPVVAVAMLAAWVGSDLAEQSLGGEGLFVEEVRHGSLLFAALLLLSLAESLHTAAEARNGMLMLRRSKGAGFALGARWLGLWLALLPLLFLSALAAGGGPASPLGLVAQVAVLVAGGVALGACLERRRMVPALWCLAILGHLRPWLATLEGSWAWTWCVPDLGALGAGNAVPHGLLWALGALALAQGRLARLSSR